jgi:hypothetical protein
VAMPLRQIRPAPIAIEPVRKLVSPWTRSSELCWRWVDGAWCPGAVEVRVWETPNARQWEYRCAKGHTREVGMTCLPGERTRR